MNIRFPDLVSVYTDSGVFGDRWADGELSLGLTEDVLSVRVRGGKMGICHARLRWTFAAGEKRREPVKIYGDAWERAGGDLEWRGIVPERCMPWFCLVSNGTDSDPDTSGRFTEGFGVKVGPGAMCFWQYDSAGLTLWLDLRCGGGGVVLSGRELSAAEIVFGEYRDVSAFEAGKRFCRLMSPCPKPLGAPVYGSNNWYYAYGKSSAEDILKDADIAGELCRGLSNRPFMVIDDGWTANPKNGPWDRGGAAFPDMAALAREIKSKNVRPGIWVRYVYDQGGVCGLPDEWHYPHDGDFLDVSRPEVLEYVRKTTERFVSWGYELIKFDCSTQDILGRRGYRVPFGVAADGWSFHDRQRTTAEIITDFYRAVRLGAGDAVLIGCATLSHLSAGIVEIGRTGADINGVNWDITRRMGVNTLAFRMMLHGSLFEVDADCVGITGTLPWEKIRQWLFVLSRSGTPLFVSCKPGALDEAQLGELREAFRVNSVQKDLLVPLDWMENICPERWSINGEETVFNWFDETVNTLFDGREG